MKLSVFAAALLATTAVATGAAAAGEGMAACTPEGAVYARDATIVGESTDAFDKGDFPAVEGARRGPRRGAEPRARQAQLRGTVRRNRGAARGVTVECGVEWRPSPYSEASMMAGSFYVEIQDFAAAEKALSVGLRLEPLNTELVSEAALALSRLGRNAESLAVIDRALGENTWMDALDRARLLRTRGFTLIEMGRLEEAEAAYRDSLKLQPGHKGALGELEYVAKARAGMAPSGITTVRSTTGEPSPE
ncbi:tetratricopeptide repeat protein [Caulobacter sp. 17J80-11]|uniref:tetratricopeptide repeat protein n=1 Tax=Caulobacter sp. 17J80-11 TaxID=2763502 RepID=UPI001653EC83|nr:tetratricopeptide repeat protein [Caulobacter sp. 17J80-11]MBC6982043.1 tetratricopeptide repeat protein [Caulobacter sp. 17J80-11]